MTPRPSAPIAARCCSACAGACLRPNCIAERDGHIAGFLLGRDGRSASQIGPLVAEDDDDRARCCSRARSPSIDGPVYIDFADAKTAIRAWLAQLRLCPRSGR